MKQEDIYRKIERTQKAVDILFYILIVLLGLQAFCAIMVVFTGVK